MTRIYIVSLDGAMLHIASSAEAASSWAAQFDTDMVVNSYPVDGDIADSLPVSGDEQ